MKESKKTICKNSIKYSSNTFFIKGEEYNYSHSIFNYMIIFNHECRIQISKEMFNENFYSNQEIRKLKLKKINDSRKNL